MTQPPFRDDFASDILKAVKGHVVQPTMQEVDLYACLEAAQKLVYEHRNPFPIHSIRIIEHAVPPRGWTRMWRSDGSVVVYISREMWEYMPKQSWVGVPLMEMPDTLLGGWRVLGTPVFYEREPQ